MRNSSAKVIKVALIPTQNVTKKRGQTKRNVVKVTVKGCR